MPISIDFPQGRSGAAGAAQSAAGAQVDCLSRSSSPQFSSRPRPPSPYWVDLLWFRSLGYGDVFWTTWRIEWGVFALFAIATFVLLYGAFLALKRASQASLPSARQIILGGQPVNLSIEPVLRIVGIVGSLAAAALTGTAMMAEWPTLALFWYAPHASGSIADPIFGRPLNFFLFTLPAWQLIAGMAAYARGDPLCRRRGVDRHRRRLQPAHRQARGHATPFRLARALHRRRLPAAGGRDERLSSAASSACWTITPSSRASTTPTRM